MNHLILLPQEEQSDGTYLVKDQRASYIKEFHRFECGKSYSGVLLGEGVGEAILLDSAEKHYRFALHLRDEKQTLHPITFVVALCRPQTMKKVLQYAAMLRVRELIFLPSELGEKSYRSSKILEPENMQYELIKGLEQIGSPYAPGVTILSRFAELKDCLATHTNCRILAEPKCGQNITDFLRENSSYQQGSVIALGSERGWSEKERAQFERLGFDEVTLSDDHFRIEVALVALVALVTQL